MSTFLAVLMTLFASTSDAATEEFSAVVEAYHADQNFSGAVLVATDGTVDYMRAIGVADRQQSIPITTQSEFRIASMTKVFTSVLTMKLVEEDRLDLDGVIGDYLPDYHGQGRSTVTLHHLLTYASGIENQLEPLGMKPYQQLASLEDFIGDYCSGDLVAPAGERSEYANTEYILLHAIIESVTGKSYSEFLDEAILSPLGMQHTRLSNTRSTSARWVPSYCFNDSLNVFEEDLAYFPEMYFGAGAMVSTLADLLIFDQALFGAELLNQRSTETLLTIHPEYGYTAYGLWGSSGWGNFSEPFYYRTGGILGSNANWIHTMDSGKTILVLSNTNATNLYAMSEELYLISVGKRSD